VVSIYVTHDQVEAMTLADRLVVLKEGMIQQVGRPWSSIVIPTIVSWLSFLGTPGMNFLDGRMDTRDGLRVFSYANGDTEGVLNLTFLHAVPEIPLAEPGRGRSLSECVRVDPRRADARGVECGAPKAAGPQVAPETVLPGLDRSDLGAPRRRPRPVLCQSSTAGMKPGMDCPVTRFCCRAKSSGSSRTGTKCIS